MRSPLFFVLYTVFITYMALEDDVHQKDTVVDPSAVLLAIPIGILFYSPVQVEYGFGVSSW